LDAETQNDHYESISAPLYRNYTWVNIFGVLPLLVFSASYG
jgi:hypothetical protein